MSRLDPLDPLSTAAANQLAKVSRMDPLDPTSTILVPFTAPSRVSRLDPLDPTSTIPFTAATKVSRLDPLASASTIPFTQHAHARDIGRTSNPRTALPLNIKKEREAPSFDPRMSPWLSKTLPATTGPRFKTTSRTRSELERDDGMLDYSAKQRASGHQGLAYRSGKSSPHEHSSFQSLAHTIGNATYSNASSVQPMSGPDISVKRSHWGEQRSVDPKRTRETAAPSSNREGQNAVVPEPTAVHMLSIKDDLMQNLFRRSQDIRVQETRQMCKEPWKDLNPWRDKEPEDNGPLRGSKQIHERPQTGVIPWRCRDPKYGGTLGDTRPHIEEGPWRDRSHREERPWSEKNPKYGRALVDTGPQREEEPWRDRDPKYGRALVGTAPHIEEGSWRSRDSRAGLVSVPVVNARDSSRGSSASKTSWSVPVSFDNVPDYNRPWLELPICRTKNWPGSSVDDCKSVVRTLSQDSQSSDFNLINLKTEIPPWNNQSSSRDISSGGLTSQVPSVEEVNLKEKDFESDFGIPVVHGTPEAWGLRTKCDEVSCSLPSRVSVLCHPQTVISATGSGSLMARSVVGSSMTSHGNAHFERIPPDLAYECKEAKSLEGTCRALKCDADEDLFALKNRLEAVDSMPLPVSFPVAHSSHSSQFMLPSGRSALGQNICSPNSTVPSVISVIQNSKSHLSASLVPKAELSESEPSKLEEAKVDIKEEAEGFSPEQLNQLSRKMSSARRCSFSQEDELDMANILRFFHYNHKKFRMRPHVDTRQLRTTTSSHQLLPVMDQRTGRSSVIMVSKRKESQATRRLEDEMNMDSTWKEMMESASDDKEELEDVSVEELQSLLQVGRGVDFYISGRWKI